MRPALGVAQRGSKAPSAKPWKGEGAGVLEIACDFDSDTFRAVYVVAFKEAIYVLPCFQKKSPRGSKDCKDGRRANPEPTAGGTRGWQTGAMAKRRSKKVQIEIGSGNVFADLGLAHAAELDVNGGSLERASGDASGRA
jgi:hypothetical protein